MIKVDNLTNSNREIQEGLTELTGLEMSELNGGYAAFVERATGNPDTARQIPGIVSGRLAADPSAILPQAVLGVPQGVIALGVATAFTAGRGRYTPQVTAATLGG
jgi:hypothetical protein